jgi:hypothetical protein
MTKTMVPHGRSNSSKGVGNNNKGGHSARRWSERPSAIPRSENEGTKPPYVCPGCSNHTYSNNMITRFHVQ